MRLKLSYILIQFAHGQTTTYEGDGVCDTSTEACEAYSFFFRDYMKEVVCCTEDQFCSLDYSCEELPLEMRNPDSNMNFIGCCEIIPTTTPIPTTTFVSYYEGDGYCTEDTEACEEKRNWRGKITKYADLSCCSLDWLCSDQGYIGDLSMICNDLPMHMADILLNNQTAFDECCNRPLPSDPATTTGVSIVPTTPEKTTTETIITTLASNENKTSYIGDGYCDSNEGCQEEKNFWGSITIQQDLACCSEYEVCGTGGLIPQNQIQCHDLPLDYRYEYTNSTYFYYCCELTTPEPTTPLPTIQIISELFQSLKSFFLGLF